MGKRVLVCGGRDFSDCVLFERTMGMLKDKHHITMIIEGGATGADTMAREWAEDNHYPVTIFPANWKAYGRRAGPIRNLQMPEQGKPDLVVAFPGNVGTADMVKKARRAGIEPIEVQPRAGYAKASTS